MVIDPLKSVITNRKVSHCATIHFNQQSRSKNVQSLFVLLFLSFQKVPCVMSPRESLPLAFYRFHELIGALFISAVSSHTVLTNTRHPYFTALASQLVREMCVFFSKGQVCVCFCVWLCMCVAVV